MLKIKAHKNPSITIPFTNLAASKTTKALMINENNPNVKIVNGKPRIFKIGVTIKFNKPKTKAKIMADPNPSIWTPLKIFVNKKATTAVTNNLIIIFIIYFFIKLKN